MSTDKILKTLEEKKFKFVDLRFCDTLGKAIRRSKPEPPGRTRRRRSRR